MSRRVMIVDADVDALGTLASALRARGLQVQIASEIYDAVEQAYQKPPHVVLSAWDLDRDGDLSSSFAAVPALSTIPILHLVSDANDPARLPPTSVRRTDVDHIATRILELGLGETAVLAQQEIRGNVQQMPLVDLLQLLTMNQRSGVLSVTGGRGSGEMRLFEGQVVDASYRRLEGEKAFFRMLGEQQGHFLFAPREGEQKVGSSARRGEPFTPPAGIVRQRISTSTNVLLMEAMRQLDELRRLRKQISPASEVFLATDAVASSVVPLSGPSKLEREILVALSVPRSLDELCDELSALDLAVVSALAKLVESHKVQAMPLASLTAPFAPPEQLSILRALVSRLTPKGFLPPPRMVIAASHRRMLGLSHAVRYIEGAESSSDLPPASALPRPFGTLSLGDGATLSLVGLPTDDTFAPLWSLALPGAVVVVRIDGAGGDSFEMCCEAAEAQLLEAERLVTELDVAVPAHVAALVRGAIESAAGV